MTSDQWVNYGSTEWDDGYYHRWYDTDPLSKGVALKVATAHSGSYGGQMKAGNSYSPGMDGVGVFRKVANTENKEYYKIKGYLYLKTGCSQRLGIGLIKRFPSSCYFYGMEVGVSDGAITFKGMQISNDDTFYSLTHDPGTINFSSDQWAPFELIAFRTPTVGMQITLTVDGTPYVAQVAVPWETGDDTNPINIMLFNRNYFNPSIIFDDLEYYV